MKDRQIVIKFIQLLSIILLYYITGTNNMFLYVVTLSLYNIYSSCFKHITIKDKLSNIDNNYSKFKLLKYTAFVITIICLLFVLLSILMSDTINVLLNIENTFMPYLIMSISVIADPLIKIFLEYLESYNKPKLSNRLLNTHYILDTIVFLIISILTIRVFKLPTHISIALLYLSKIFSSLIVGVVVYLILKKENIFLDKVEENKINYKQEIKEVLKNNSHKSIIYIVKNSYYYISIIILYMILSTKYSYNIDLIEKNITFIYLYGLSIIDFVIYIVLFITKNNSNKSTNIISYIINIFRFMITNAIILAVTSPLLCKIIFNDSSSSIYMLMLSFLSIFIALYDITYENVKNKKIIYTSLIIGIISKILLIVPLINSFYRMGYNLVYGDIISTIISMFLSVIINYIYLKNKNKKEKTLEKILTTLYESMLLCIILIILQFIIPIKTNNYIISIIIFIVYISISIIFLKFQKKKRG